MKYTEASSISHSETYYIKNGSGYTEVKYCNGEDHLTGTCSGGPGWYTGIYRWEHTSENKITPKDSNHPNGTQFFVRSEEACSSRLSALKKAVSTFVDQVSKEATKNDVDHRIAIVGFSSNAGTDFENTEILTGCTVNNNNNGVQYVAKPSSGTSDAYKAYISACGKALVTPQSAKAAINYLEANGGTETDKGMQMAKDILDNDSKRTLIVIALWSCLQMACLRSIQMTPVAAQITVQTEPSVFPMASVIRPQSTRSVSFRAQTATF